MSGFRFSRIGLHISFKTLIYNGFNAADERAPGLAKRVAKHRQALRDVYSNAGLYRAGLLPRSLAMTRGDLVTIVLPGDYATPLFRVPVEPTADTGLIRSLAVNRVLAVFLVRA